MQPQTTRRGFLRAAAVLALETLLRLWRPQAAALAQSVEQERPEKPSQQPAMTWSNQLTQSDPDPADGQAVTVKLVVTNMATNETSYLVLDMNQSYLLELSVT